MRGVAQQVSLTSPDASPSPLQKVLVFILLLVLLILTFTLTLISVLLDDDFLSFCHTPSCIVPRLLLPQLYLLVR